jgi:hypothetical protein
LQVIARILADLLTGNFKYGDSLLGILNSELDILAISSQAKQEIIIPALIGIMNTTEVQLQ